MSATAVSESPAPALAEIFSGCSGKIEIRTINAAGKIVQRYFSDPMEAIRYAGGFSDQANVYFGACTRMRSRGTKADVQEVPALWADCDTPESVERLKSFPFEPTMTIETSPGRLHAWWLLREPMLMEDDSTIGTVESVLRGIADALHSDPAVAEIARIMRVPGTTNIKRGNAACRVQHQGDRRYDLSEFITAGYLAEAQAHVNGNGHRPERVDTAAVLAGVPEGQRDVTLFRFVCKLRGADVPQEFAERLALEAAAKCSPPYPTEKVREKVVRVYEKYAAGEAEKLKWSDLRTELGYAREFVRLHGDDVRFVVLWKKWLRWDGTRWKLDDTGEVRRLAKRFTRAATQAALDANDKDAIQICLRMEQARKLEAWLSLAATEAEVAISPDVLDRDPWALNVENGMLDLRTGRLRPHRRDDLITKLAAVRFDADATAPAWDSFLERVLPDPDVREFMRRYLGYSLTADVGEQVLAFLYGIGANGKSTMLVTTQKILGDYATQAPPDLLLASSIEKGTQHPTGLTDLFGRRLAICTEVGEGRALAEVLVKQITGGDRIKARRMREDFWYFDPTHKIILAANHRPAVRGTDHAIWRRILLVPFAVVIPESERDRRLPEKLIAEAPGILRWMVDGCIAWQRDGLKPSRAVRAATEEYREEQDAIGGFLEDRCTINPLKDQIHVSKGDLHREYLTWAGVQGESDPLTMRAFGERIRERGIEDGRHGDARTRIWKGLGLKAPEHTRRDGADS